jgi:hypothetical protein
MMLMQIVLGFLILAVLSAGALVIGRAMTSAEKQEKPKLFSIALVVFVSGAVLGFLAVDLFLRLEGGVD